MEHLINHLESLQQYEEEKKCMTPQANVVQTASSAISHSEDRRNVDHSQFSKPLHIVSPAKKVSTPILPKFSELPGVSNRLQKADSILLPPVHDEVSKAINLQTKLLNETVNFIISKISQYDLINPDSSALSIIAMAIDIQIPKILQILGYPNQNSIVYKDVRMNCVKFLKLLDNLSQSRNQKLKLYEIFQQVLHCTSQDKWDEFVKRVIRDFLVTRAKDGRSKVLNYSVDPEFDQLCMTQEINIQYYTLDSTFKKVFLLGELAGKRKKPKHFVIPLLLPDTLEGMHSAELPLYFYGGFT